MEKKGEVSEFFLVSQPGFFFSRRKKNALSISLLPLSLSLSFLPLLLCSPPFLCFFSVHDGSRGGGLPRCVLRCRRRGEHRESVERIGHEKKLWTSERKGERSARSSSTFLPSNDVFEKSPALRPFFHDLSRTPRPDFLRFQSMCSSHRRAKEQAFPAPRRGEQRSTKMENHRERSISQEDALRKA